MTTESATAAVKRPTRNVRIEGNSLTYGRTWGHRMFITNNVDAGHIVIRTDRPEMFIEAKDAKQIANFLTRAVAQQKARSGPSAAVKITRAENAKRNRLFGRLVRREPGCDNSK